MRVLARPAHNRELQATTRDVSYRGLYFLADSQFEIGSEIEFVLRLPQKISQNGDVDIRCHGQVVRVESATNGTIGVAAKIERYEFLPANAHAA